MAKILIVGCGAIGRELGNHLSDAGHQVTGLKRNPPKVNPDKFVYYKADITLLTGLQKLDKDYDYVFFIVSPDHRDIDSYRSAFDTGLSNLTRLLPGAVWFFISSTSVYGQSKGEWVDENSLASGNSSTSKIIVAAEKRIHVLNPGNIVVRFSGIYGPGREYLLRQAKQNSAVQQDPPYFTNRIHQRDCVGSLVFLLNQHLNGVKLSSCYLASDDCPAPMWEVMSWLTEQLSYPPPLAKTTPQDADMNKRCSNDRLKNLGYRFTYPDFRDGYSELIRSIYL